MNNEAAVDIPKNKPLLAMPMCLERSGIKVKQTPEAKEIKVWTIKGGRAWRSKISSFLIFKCENVNFSFFLSVSGIFLTKITTESRAKKDDTPHIAAKPTPSVIALPSTGAMLMPKAALMPSADIASPRLSVATKSAT